jgi:hypothetical protein
MGKNFCSRSCWLPIVELLKSLEMSIFGLGTWIFVVSVKNQINRGFQNLKDSRAVD